MSATLTPSAPATPPDSNQASRFAADTAVTPAPGRAVSASTSVLEDVRISIRHKISALWIVVLFLYAYGDIFGFFRTGTIKDVMGGKVSGIEITQGFLLAVSVYIAIASAMVFLSLVLRPRVNRWTNIVLPILYIVSIVGTCIGETWAFYFLTSAAESVLLALIVWYAWTWPRREANRD
jgi:Family of unknown function (DUF6326)